MSDLRMPDLNSVTIAGRMARDPELRYTQNGKPWATCALCNTRYYKGADGERKEETVFVDFTVWGPAAEYVGKLKKGRPVLVEGGLQANEWEKDGVKHTRLRINAHRVTPLDWEPREGAQDTPRATKTEQAEYPEPAQDDIPF